MEKFECLKCKEEDASTQKMRPLQSDLLVRAIANRRCLMSVLEGKTHADHRKSNRASKNI